MRLVNCLFPRVVRNPYTGEVRQVPCGMCEACLNVRSANWVQRLDVEMSAHKYTYFATFQYDDQHVPQLVRLRLEDTPRNGIVSYLDSLTGEVISLGDVPGYQPKDVTYCLQTKVLNRFDITDFQKFIKLLRYEISKLGKNISIRYFTACEFGPTTYRGHFHSLFFFDSALLEKEFVRLLSENWEYGRVYDPHPVVGSCSQYVSSYVNSYASLPAIYRHKVLRQRSLFSKRPPIGSMAVTDSQVFEIVSKADSTFRIYDKLRHDFSYVPLWRFLQNRCFPKLPRYGQLSFADRVTLYRAPIDPWCSAVENARMLQRSTVRCDNNKSFLAEYLRTITKIPSRGRSASQRALVPARYCFDTLVRFCRIVARVQRDCDIYCLRLEDYVKQIDNFYDKKQKSDLKEWFELQDEYFKTHPVSDFLTFDVNYLRRLKRTAVPSISQRIYLDVCGLTLEQVKSLDETNTHAYRELSALHVKIFHDNTKTKCQNDYLIKHKDKFGNIINYKNS